MEKDYYFIFKDINSLDIGVEIVTFPPIIKPEKDTEIIEIPGRNGHLTIDNESYKSYNISIECLINPFAKNTASINDICSWLNGKGDLILSQESDKVYKANIIGQIAISDVINVFPTFMVTFEVQPLKKSVNTEIIEITEFSKNSVIVNIGNVPSNPIITIYGNGDVTLTVNDTPFLIRNIEEYIVINSELQEVYKDGINENFKYNNFEFPIFQVGKNDIKFNGEVTKTVININTNYI